VEVLEASAAERPAILNRVCGNQRELPQAVESMAESEARRGPIDYRILDLLAWERTAYGRARARRPPSAKILRSQNKLR
jgi:hypothetical protein